MFRFAAASSKPSTLAQTVIRLGAVAAACSALTWSLSGCGGGSRAKDYVPDSVVSFGDENSAMEDYSSSNLDPSASPNGTDPKTVQGLVYTVNAVVDESVFSTFSHCNDASALNKFCDKSTADLTPFSETVTGFVGGTPHAYYFPGVNADGFSNIVTYVSNGTGSKNGGATTSIKRTYNVTYACSTSRLWNQIVAHSFNKGFESKCALDLDGAQTYAAYGAKVAELQTQVSTHRSELRDGVLVTVMIGQNDILEMYDDVIHSRRADSEAQSILETRGALAAAIIKDILATGAKVVLALTPDLGQSPLAFAVNQQPALLTAYTTKFNNALKFGMGSVAAQDGRHFALVESDLFTNPITRSASYVHGTALCDMAATFKHPDGSDVTNQDADDYAKRLKYCNANTMVTNGSVATYMWADDTHFAPAGHAQVGSLAASRVYNQF